MSADQRRSLTSGMIAKRTAHNVKESAAMHDGQSTSCVSVRLQAAAGYHAHAPNPRAPDSRRPEVAGMRMLAPTRQPVATSRPDGTGQLGRVRDVSGQRHAASGLLHFRAGREERDARAVHLGDPPGAPSRDRSGAVPAAASWTADAIHNSCQYLKRNLEAN